MHFSMAAIIILLNVAMRNQTKSLSVCVYMRVCTPQRLEIQFKQPGALKFSVEHQKRNPDNFKWKTMQLFKSWMLGVGGKLLMVVGFLLKVVKYPYGAEFLTFNFLTKK